VIEGRTTCDRAAGDDSGRPCPTPAASAGRAALIVIFEAWLGEFVTAAAMPAQATAATTAVAIAKRT